MNRSRNRPIPAPPLSRVQIIQTAERLSESYIGSVGLMAVLQQGLKFERVFESVIYPQFEITLHDRFDLGADDDAHQILGEYDWVENIVYIDRSLGQGSADPRRTFTCWHEIGHAVLHGPWLRSRSTTDTGENLIVTTEDSLHPDAIETMERQANLFASHAAAPGQLLDAALAYTFRPTAFFPFFRPCVYCFHCVGVRQRRYVESFADLCLCIARFIKPIFGGLSTEALSYRLAKHPLVRDRSVADHRLHRMGRAALAGTPTLTRVGSVAQSSTPPGASAPARPPATGGRGRRSSRAVCGVLRTGR